MDLHHAMHDGNVACVENSTSESGYAEVLISTRSLAVLNLEDDDLAHPDRVRLIIEEQDVAALKRRLHAARQHHDDGRFAFR